MNGNAYDGINELKRMEITYKDLSYVFDLNPETYDFKIPNRVNVHYTKGGAIVDLFGSGLKELNITGTTGFRSNTGDNQHGYKKFLELKKSTLHIMDDIEDGRPVKHFLNFYNHTDGEAYVTVPIRLNISRNVNQPLIYKYDLQLYIIRRVGDPEPSSTLQVVGNPLGSPNTASSTVKDAVVVESGDLTDIKFSKENIDEAKKEDKKVTRIVSKRKSTTISRAPTISTGRDINSRS